MQDKNEDGDVELGNMKSRVAGDGAPLTPTTGAKMSDSMFWSLMAPYMNRGSMSNLCTFVIMLIGIIMVAEGKRQDDDGLEKAGDWVLAFGLFGFAGGVTNWLAIKMLFDRIPGLAGSGVIPRRFKEIRQVVKDTMMDTFFDQAYLDKYMGQKVKDIGASLNLDEKVKEVLESDEVDALIDKNLEELSSRPEGMWMTMMNLTPAALKPMIKPFVLGMGGHIGPTIMEVVSSSDLLSVDQLRLEIDRLMTQKLQELTPERVKKLMEDVIRQHLGWLIVWGNVFGGLIGILSKAAGYGG